VSLRKQAAYALGLVAERQAAAFLESLGYGIVGVRVRTQGGEIDLLATHGDTLVVVEVKARKQSLSALESITPSKRARIERAVEALFAEPEKNHGLDLTITPNIRFDVVVVTPDSAPHHVPDAWRPEYANI
jgi:putative endonuclease